MARASAPLRLDLAGGWTDVPPFSAREGGHVVNATIGLYAHAAVEPGGEGVLLTSEDLQDQLRVSHAVDLTRGGRLALLKSAIRLFPVEPCEVISRSEAPPGSGLGSSGALDVALVSALLRARGEELDRPAVAHAAWKVEVEDAGMAGGKQDQYAAALGGVLSLTFNDPDVIPEPLSLDPEFARHLERHLVICYTGRSRVSGDMIQRVMTGYETGKPGITSALKGMKEVAERMVAALRQSDLASIGSLLSENWRYQRLLDPGMRTDMMARLEQAVESVGVLGGKAAGAGAGGCMFFLATVDPVAVAAAAREAGATVLPTTLVREGVRTW